MSGESSKSFTSLSHLPRGAIDVKGNPVDRNARLPSIRRPRDLNLVANPKLQFSPKIPVRRAKQVETKPATKPEPVSRNYANNSTNRSHVPRQQQLRMRNPRQFLQTPGSIFADPKQIPSKKEKNARHEARACSDSTPVIETKMDLSERLTVKKEKKEPHLISHIEKEDIDSVSSSDFSDEEDEILNSFVPNVLPLNLMVKDSKDSVCDAIMDKISQLPDLIRTLNTPGNKELMLLEFPNSFYLPFESLDPANDPPLRNLVTETCSEMLSKQHLPLGSLPEGCIGKLQVLRSGKTRLVTGSVVYDEISLEKSSSVLQHAMSLQSDLDNRYDLTMLGNLQHKLRILPNLQKLLTKSHIE